MSKIYHLGARAAAAALVVCMVTGCTAAPPADRTPANETGATPAASNSQASNSNAASSEKSALSQPASQRSSSDTKVSSTHDALSTDGNDESRTDGETSGESTSAAEKQAQNANVLTLKSEPSPAEQANAEPVEALPNGKAVYTDSSGNPLAGEWRYEGADCVFDAEGHLVASGQALGTKGRLCIPSAGVDVFEHVARNEAPTEVLPAAETTQNEESPGGMQPNSVWTDNAGDSAPPQGETYPEDHYSAEAGGPEFGAQGGMDR